MSRIHTNFKRFRDEDAATVLASLNTNKKSKVDDLNKNIIEMQQKVLVLENKLKKKEDSAITLQNDYNTLFNNYNRLLNNAIKNQNTLIQKITLRDNMICDILHLIDNNLLSNIGPVPLKIKMAHTYTQIKNPDAEHYFLKECKYISKN
jgi:predicted nuclease with TOPRIM domain